MVDNIRCCCSVAKSCLTLPPHGLQHAKLPCPSLSRGVCSNELVMLSNHLILYCPILLLSSVFPSIRVFSNELLFASGTKVLELQLQHQSFQWIFSLISFRIDWFNLLAVQISLKNLLQHHYLKASIWKHDGLNNKIEKSI